MTARGLELTRRGAQSLALEESTVWAEAGRQWPVTLRKHLEEMGFAHLAADECLFVKSDSPTSYVWILVYVDNLLIIASSQNRIGEALGQLEAKVKVKRIGEPRKFVGLEVQRDRDAKKIYLKQPVFAKDVVKRF